MRKRAFTLIELLVVISIVALLSSVVLASLNSAREKGRLAAARDFEAQIEHAAGDYAVGIWDFNDCSGTNAVDRSGYNDPGVISGTFTWSADTPSGSGCSFFMDGNTQAVNVTGTNSSTVLDFGASTDFTLSAWVKAVSLANSPFIIDKRSTYGGAAGGYTLRLDSSTGRPCLRMGDNVNVYDLCASSGSYTDGKWHHFAIAVDRAASATFYGDGQMIGSASMSGVGNIDRPAVGLHFGTKDGLATNALNGYIDDVRIFAKKLTAADIGKIYAQNGSRAKVALKQ